MSLLQNSNAISAGGYDVNNSLRFRSSASAYLSRTPASAGNRQKWTWSGWVKRSAIGTNQYVFSAFNTTSANQTNIQFGGNATDDLTVYSNTGGTQQAFIATTAVYRDVSSWYHIVVAWDTTQATAANRVKIYINGAQVTALAQSSYPSQNYDGHVNTAVSHAIGATPAPSAYFNGYLAETNFIDGQALTPSSFGETDTITGVWKPKAYTGTYGTNGFYLKFSDIATTSGSNAGLGKDFSGNSNYWTTNNISVTSGTTYDAMTDVPTNTSATVANYCTLNPLRYGTGTSSTTTISDGNLKITCSSNAGSVVGTINIPSSGKWYWEAVVPTQTYNYMMIGVIKNQEALANLNAGVGFLSTGYAVYAANGQKYNNSANSAYMAAPAQNTVVTVAYDADTGSLYVGAGGSWANGSGSTNQTWSGAVAAYTGITGDISPAVSFDSGNCIVNFGQRPFTYTPPTGFVALNTYNLPTPTILQGNKYMDATLYNGATTGFSVTNAGSFAPDMLWIKLRNAAGSHVVVDSVRGSSKVINTDLTNAEATSNAGTGVLSLNSNGFTLGTDTSTAGVTNGVGTGSRNFVAWQWQAGQGSTSSNTSGSITSTVSVNTNAGFSIVTYTGTQVNATVGHGLGVAPKMVIVKRRSVSPSNWVVWHTAIPNTDYLLLNTTAAKGTLATVWNSTTPTSTTFSIGTDADVNSNSATIVAYCWAEIAGFSKFGSYVGNGSTDGTFVFTNLKARFIMIKRTDSTSNWTILDTAREGYNVDNDPLYPNLSDAEGTTDLADILSNGFKLRSTDTSVNANAGTYIYACFSSNPFKNSTAV